MTGYGLDGPGIDPGGGEIFRTCPDRPWGPPNLLYNGYQVFPCGKERLRRDADPSPPSSAVGHETVELYLYSPYRPYGLCRASVPVQGWPLPLPYSRAIPLLPLWAVRPVQNLSGCTRGALYSVKEFIKFIILWRQVWAGLKIINWLLQLGNDYCDLEMYTVGYLLQYIVTLSHC
jgi:hypothetical protein